MTGKFAHETGVADFRILYGKTRFWPAYKLCRNFRLMTDRSFDHPPLRTSAPTL
jgi:hypothetical protein